MQHSFIATGEETHFSIWIHGDLGSGGDVIFDHTYLVTEEEFLSCSQTFTLQGPSKFIKICHIFLLLYDASVISIVFKMFLHENI